MHLYVEEHDWGLEEEYILSLFKVLNLIYHFLFKLV